MCVLQQNATYGLTHAYAADPFNEMAPQSFNESYLSDVASAIYMGAAASDPDAIWYRLHATAEQIANENM